MPFPQKIVERIEAENAEKLEAIYSASEDVLISKNTAVKLIGVNGRRRLERLVNKELTEKNKSNSHQHGRWYCRLSDILKYIARDIQLND